MFTIQQIKDAHAKVKSGADFPRYIQDIKALGVVAYEQYVADGHTIYKGTDNFSEASAAKYSEFTIAQNGNTDALKLALIIHQQGKTDYLTFCKQAADAGVEKWVVNIPDMTCIYFDRGNNEMVKEIIPSV